MGSAELAVSVHIRRDNRKTEEIFTNLHVSNIDSTTTEEDLRKMFEAFGEITSVHIPKSESETTYGFVSFKNPEHAAKAIESMDRKSIPSGKIIIVCKHINRRQNEVRGNNSDNLTPIAQ